MNIRKYGVILVLFAVILAFVACDGKNTPIHDLEEVCSDLQENSDSYTEDDWAAVAESLERINADIENYRSQYTDDDMREIGRLKGICMTFVARHSVQSFSNRLRDAFLQIEGAVDGASEILKGDDDTLSE